MASVTPRISGLWSSEYFREPMGEEAIEEQEQGLGLDGRSALDRTIDRIGMGSYQWTLLALCGFGWMADNMWIETIAIILPRVQQHYSIPDNWIGYVSSSMFAGMMVGAVAWGSCSDVLGRSTAFNLTLFFTAVFGLLASTATSFVTLCILLFLLGTAVGGSMPTDGTLLLEHMPRGKEYLVTALSVFFSLGSVVSAIVGILVIPGHSCSQASPGQEGSAITCDVDKENNGWKYLLMASGTITLAMFLGRIVFFRLYESPRYLVSAGRHHEALVNLKKISKFNGSELDLEIEDVNDVKPVVSNAEAANADEAQALFADRVEAMNSRTPILMNPDAVQKNTRRDVRTIFDADIESGLGGRHSNEQVDEDGTRETSPFRGDSRRSSGSAGSKTPEQNYDSTGLSHVPLDSHVYNTPRADYPPMDTPVTSGSTVPLLPDSGISARERRGAGLSLSLPPFPEEESGQEPKQTFSETASPPRSSRRLSRASQGVPRTPMSTLSTSSRHSKLLQVKRRVCWALPRRVRKPLLAWTDKLSLVLAPEWLRTTLLVWAMWGSMSLAYTMFNVFLPKLLEMRSSPGSTPGEQKLKSLEEAMWDVVIFTVGGCPGAILGAYLVESPLGRRWTLASSTFITAVLCLAFIYAESSLMVRLSTIGISLSTTTMWSVLYGWTPEIFATEVRGTACGTASALSRIGGMIAPVLGGALLVAGPSLPVYVSIVVFGLAGIWTVMLTGHEREDNAGSGERIIVH